MAGQHEQSSNAGPMIAVEVVAYLAQKLENKAKEKLREIEEAMWSTTKRIARLGAAGNGHCQGQAPYWNPTSLIKNVLLSLLCCIR